MHENPSTVQPRNPNTVLHRNPWSGQNREISSTPWCDDQGRSAKAINRTADMHMLEKSDCAVVCAEQRTVQEG